MGEQLILLTTIQMLRYLYDYILDGQIFTIIFLVWNISLHLSLLVKNPPLKPNRSKSLSSYLMSSNHMHELINRTYIDMNNDIYGKVSLIHMS